MQPSAKRSGLDWRLVASLCSGNWHESKGRSPRWRSRGWLPRCGSPLEQEVRGRLLEQPGRTSRCRDPGTDAAPAFEKKGRVSETIFTLNLASLFSSCTYAHRRSAPLSKNAGSLRNRSHCRGVPHQHSARVRTGFAEGTCVGPKSSRRVDSLLIQ